MEKINLMKSKSIKSYKVGMIIKVKDKMQKNYSYKLEVPIGKDFDPEFKPYLTPDKMLAMGVFEGHYLNDCTEEFPKEWFQKAINKLSPEKPDISLNYFKIKSRLSLQEWIRRKWITKKDPDVRGWFQWYCRYYLGRRDPKLDYKQIKRWKSFKRHAAQVSKNCKAKDVKCRPRQRQALLQWAYDPLI